MKSREFLYLVILLCQPLAIIPQACPSGWFGQDCMYKCNCAAGSVCSDQGVCDPKRCFKDSTVAYFGPGCQYVDMAVGKGATVTHPYMTDYDDSTCLFMAIKTVKIKLPTAQNFLWIRFVNHNTDPHASKTTYINGIMINDKDHCQNMQFVPVDAITVDVYCTNSRAVHTIWITGPGDSPFHMCSVYVSGGRNIAVKQAAVQSTTLDDSSNRGVADGAVDGNPDPNFESGKSCAHTTLELNPWWKTTFNRPMILTRIELINRDSYQNRLLDFVLTTYGMNNQKLEELRGSKAISSIYILYPTSNMPVSSLQVSLPRLDYLALCEVKTFGETWCPDGTYGLWCQHPCSCAPTQSCNLVTGFCMARCPTGHYGLSCSESCHSTSQCSVNYCHDRYGSCLACQDGYSGTYCEQVCPKGTYGVNCSLDCSSRCLDTCHHILGNCTCKERTKQPNCGVSGSDCPRGTYGDNCGYNCSVGCVESCDKIEGTCSCKPLFTGPKCTECLKESYIGPNCDRSCESRCANKCTAEYGNCICHPQFTGFRCEDCANGLHGDNCNRTCPSSCGDHGACNRTTGHCFTCKGDQTLPLCEGDQDSENPMKEGLGVGWLWIILVLLLLPLALCLLFIFIWFRRRPTPAAEASAPEEEEKPVVKEVGLSPEELEELKVSGSQVDVVVQESPSTSVVHDVQPG